MVSACIDAPHRAIEQKEMAPMMHTQVHDPWAWQARCLEAAADLSLSDASAFGIKDLYVAA